MHIKSEFISNIKESRKKNYAKITRNFVITVLLSALFLIVGCWIDARNLKLTGNLGCAEE